MADYKIISDSTSDLSTELVSRAQVHIIPMLYHVDGKDFLNSPEDGPERSHEFYELLRGGKLSTTTQINVDTFTREFTPWLEQGLDILYLCFSSGLSSTIGSAKLAADDLKQQFPDRKIVIVDTLCASMGEGLLVYLAAMKKQREGLSLEELAQWAEDTKLHLAHWFTVEDLNHLKRGGRVSAAAALVGTMLNIKPVLHVDDEGHLIPVEKIRGRRASLDSLVSHMKKTAIEPENQTIFISHGDSPKDAEYVANRVRETMGVKEIYINPIGPVIGTHSGPGTVALFFLAESRS